MEQPVSHPSSLSVGQPERQRGKGDEVQETLTDELM